MINRIPDFWPQETTRDKGLYTLINFSKRNDVKTNNLHAPISKLKTFKEFTDLQGIGTNQMVEQGKFNTLLLVIGKLGREKSLRIQKTLIMQLTNLI